LNAILLLMQPARRASRPGRHVAFCKALANCQLL